MSIRGIRRALSVPRITRKGLEREVDDEIAFHVAQRAEQLCAAGMSAEEAHAEAVRRFGDMAWVRDECVDVDHSELRRDRMMSFFDHLRGDVRFAWRSLRRAPGFTAVALTTLTVGIASVTAIFSFVYGYAFRPLPYKDASRIVAIEERKPGGALFGGFDSWTISLDASRAILGGTRSFERVAVFATVQTRASVAGKPSDLSTLRIDTSFAAMFGLNAQRGRLLTAEEIATNAPVAMISDVLWRASFGADPTIVGRPIRLGDELITIVGVMPADFRYPYQTDLWRPFRFGESSMADANITLLGKLAPGVTRRAVAGEMSLISRRLTQNDARQFAGVKLAVQEMLDRRVGGALPIVGIFIGAAILVLLIACSNVANLLLVRAAERRGEMAVRSSLGAGRRRLIAQALMEAVVLATLAGVFGSLLSVALVKLALAYVPTAGFPSWLTFGIDGRIVLFVVGIVSLVTLTVGLTPAREGTRFDLVRALKVGGDAGTVNSGVARSARRAIVVQLALSVVLFVGASLLVQTYRRLAVVDVGYPAEEIVALKGYFDQQRYPNDTAKMRFASAVLDRMTAMVGVRHAAIRGTANWMELFGTKTAIPATRSSTRDARPDMRLFADGDTTRSRSQGMSIYPFPRFFVVSDAYFQTLGLHVAKGRALTPNDVSGSTPVVVLSKRFAEILWPKENPLGRVIQLGAKGTRISVIGTVDDVRDLQGGNRGVSASARADAYFSIRQTAAWNPEVLIRGSGNVAAIQAGAESAARRVDPEMPTTAHTLARDTEGQRMATKLFGTLIGAFAICGLILSVIGIYGVVAYGITQRTREIGIRIALGGTSRDVLQLVLRQALRFVGTGLAAGVILSLGAARLLRVLLFGVTATDPLTYAMVCVLFGGVAVVACYLPARRVTRVDPLTALRTD